MQWLAPLDTGSTPLSSYVVRWEGGSQTVGADQTAIVVSGLVNGTGYSFVVFAVNEAGAGPASAPSAVVFPGGVPAAPAQVMAVGGAGNAVITWQEPEGRGRPITGYTVTSFSGESVTTSATTATLTGLSPGRYTFSVTATNSFGTSAPASSNETVVAVPLPGMPRDVTAEVTSTGALVRWAAPTANGGAPNSYVVRSLPEGLTATTTTTEAAITGLQPGLAYKFWVSATNESGEGERSPPSQPLMLKQGPACSSTTPFFGGAPDPVDVFRPLALSAASLDNDGMLDLAVIDATTLYVAKGRGNGTFDRKVSHRVGHNASALSVGDLNGDSFSDVVVVNGDAGVSVFLNDAVGGLLNPAVYPSGGEATFVALTRIDSNTSLDLAVLNHEEGTLTVMLNDGAGGFVPRAPRLVGSRPWSLAAADFNRDGVTDLAITASPIDVYVLIGTGDGAFQPTPLHLTLTSGATRAIVAGDFDHDGDADLLVPSAGSGGGVMFHGNGDATFSGSSFPVDGLFLTSGNVNGDGEQDLVSLIPALDQLQVFRGSATGSFQLASTQLVGNEPVWAALGDFNNDGLGDIVTANQGNPFNPVPTGSVSMLLGTASGFSTPTRTMFGQFAMTAFVADDFDVDGHLDLAVGQQEGPGSWEVKMLRGDGNGGFLAEFTVGRVGTAAEMRSGDFNRDGLPDLAVTDVGPNGSGLAIFIGSGGGSFHPRVEYGGNGAMPYSFTMSDFNGDGFSDFALATHSYFGVDVYLGSATGTFGTAQRNEVGGGPRSIASGDFNGDGKIDLATANESSNSVSVLFGLGNGSFSRSDVALGTRSIWIAAADLNGDPFSDLVTANQDANSLTVLFGGANGFAPAVTIQLPMGSREVKAVDVTLDGKIDVLVALDSGRILLLKGNGDGTFAPAVFFSTNSAHLAFGQFDGDGRVDIAVLGAGVTVLKNVCAP